MMHLEQLPADVVAAQWLAFAFDLYQTGFMMSMSLVTVPVIQANSVSAVHSLNQFKSFHTHGHFYGPASTMAISLLHAYTAFRKSSTGRPWLLSAAAGALSISVWPFTILLMDPINDLLFEWKDTAAKISPGLVHEKFSQWNWLHATRTEFLWFGALAGFLAIRQAEGYRSGSLRHSAKSKRQMLSAHR